MALWLTWWGIAEDHAKEASLEAIEHGDGFGEVLPPAMIAIVASASSLGGLAGSVREHSKIAMPAFNSKTGEDRKALEVLKRAFEIGTKEREWRNEFEWLFHLRNPLVHPAEKFREPVLHPENSAIQVSVETIHYSAANAERAVALVRDVAGFCFDNPKPAIRLWCEMREGIVRRRLGGEFD